MSSPVKHSHRRVLRVDLITGMHVIGAGVMPGYHDMRVMIPRHHVCIPGARYEHVTPFARAIHLKTGLGKEGQSRPSWTKG